MIVDKFLGVVVVDECLACDKVDDSLELVLGTDRKTDRNGICAELGVDLLDTGEEVGTYTVHLVDISDFRNAVLVSLTPDGLRLRLYAAYCTECGNGTVKDAE